MAKPTIDVPVSFLQGLLTTLYRLEILHPDDQEIDWLITGVNTALLEINMHPQQKLIDAGFYAHLLPDNGII